MKQRKPKHYLLRKLSGRELRVVATTEKKVVAMATAIGGVAFIDRLDKNWNYLYTL